MKRIIHPNGIINVKYNGKSVHPNIMTGVMGFFILYMFIFAISSLDHVLVHTGHFHGL